MIEQFRNRLVGIIFLFVYAVVLAACPANSPITDSSSAADTTPTTASAATPVDETANLTSTVNSVESESATPANAGSAVTFTIVPGRPKPAFPFMSC
ncbi:MAG: hypothetical protein R2932_34845 [Caldilineaceae bacterium]